MKQIEVLDAIMESGKTTGIIKCPTLEYRLRNNLNWLKMTQPEITNIVKGRKAKVITNQYYEYFMNNTQSGIRSIPRELDDILVGISRLNWYRPKGFSKPLSVVKMLKVLTYKEDITCVDIEWILKVGKRQAQRYLTASELVIQFMDRDDTFKEYLLVSHPDYEVDDYCDQY